MDDAAWGHEDSRGYWRPNDRIKYPGVFVWPPQIRSVLRWLPKYLFPWTAVYAALTLFVWVFLTPSVERMQTFSADWIGLILLRNLGLHIAIAGFQHYWLYIRRGQGAAFKYNRRWPGARDEAFTLGGQHNDNIFWSLVSGAPIWTAWECAAWWLHANGYTAQLSFAENPVWIIALSFFVPLLHEFHFYCVHRMLHVRWLYKNAHYLHHRNVNPGPWSGISMHPLEHLLYFSGMLFYFILPSHPIHFLNVGLIAGLAPAQGHTGFDRITAGGKPGVHLPYFAHYLHHKHFEVNYADGSIPLDKWFGSFHDGSPEADEQLKRRRLKRD